MIFSSQASRAAPLRAWEEGRREERQVGRLGDYRWREGIRWLCRSGDVGAEERRSSWETRRITSLNKVILYPVFWLWKQLYFQSGTVSSLAERSRKHSNLLFASRWLVTQYFRKTIHRDRVYRFVHLWRDWIIMRLGVFYTDTVLCLIVRRKIIFHVFSWCITKFRGSFRTRNRLRNKKSTLK